MNPFEDITEWEDKRFRRHIRHELEIIMASVADLTTSVAANTQAVADIQAHIASGGTVFSAADQTAFDAANSQVLVNNAALDAIATPPAPAVPAATATPVVDPNAPPAVDPVTGLPVA